jgi:hypothetical protein
MNDQLKEQIEATLGYYDAERDRVTRDFNAFWDTHFNRISKRGNVVTCNRGDDYYKPCGHPIPPEPESEDDTARRIVTEPLGEPFPVSFGRWMRVLGMGEAYSDERMDTFEPLCVVAWRWAVLGLIRQGWGLVEPSAAGVETVEEQLDQWRKDAEL